MYDSYLEHYGTPRHSGRYPWGSGKDPQRNIGLHGRIKKLKEQGLTDSEIAKGMGFKNVTQMKSYAVYGEYNKLKKEGKSEIEIAKALDSDSTTQLRAKYQIARNEVIKDQIAKMKKLDAKGYSQTAIANEIGVTEGTIRNWKKQDKVPETKLDTLTKTLKEHVDNKRYLDITEGVEVELGTSKASLRTAATILEEQGYKVHTIKVPQATNPSQRTTIKVLTPGDVEYKDVWNNKDKIVSVNAKELRDDITNLNMRPPANIDSKRVYIRYDEEGGSAKDGVIEIRPGVSDLKLPNDKVYAQCRIGVDGTHYLKGMAVYSDEVPKGYDIIFNTNKKTGTPPEKVFKEQKLDGDNPFGATVRQYDNVDPKTGKKSLSPINIVNEDQDWEKWSKTLSSQFLSKQYPAVAKEQLKITYDRRKNEFDNICQLNNPTVKKKLLKDFAESCDSDAVNLKAAAFPGQATHVILPLTKIKDDEIYAPNYKNGEKVALVRYPHEGVFQIPVLTVNNKNQQGLNNLGNAKHAVGISAKAAEQLSGADFDGDTVTVIPIRGQQIKATAPLKQLADYDPKREYKKLPGDPVTGEDDKFHKQQEMGNISNLITDMTIKGASLDEIARATRHSMCIIDAEKHNLDWKRSARENGIAELKELYQGGANRGASTLISKARGEHRIDGVRTEGVTVVDPKTGKKHRQYIDPETGKKLYSVKTEEWVDKEGKLHSKTTKTTNMAVADDAYSLVSPDNTRIERIYADHANRLKALANQARKEILVTGDIKYDGEAAKKYSREVERLDSALRIAQLKAPQERRAQAIADSVIRAKIAENPELKDDRDALKKKRSQAIGAARARLGLKRYDIDISDREWEAIQAGAISKTKLEKILNRADGNRVRELATPKERATLPVGKQSQIKSLANRGYTQAEIAEHLGVSVSTVNKYL